MRYRATKSQLTEVEHADLQSPVVFVRWFGYPRDYLFGNSTWRFSELHTGDIRWVWPSASNVGGDAGFTLNVSLGSEERFFVSTTFGNMDDHTSNASVEPCPANHQALQGERGFLITSTPVRDILSAQTVPSNAVVSIASGTSDNNGRNISG